MAVNNESIGISAEVAIAKSFGVKVNPYYEARAEQAIVDLLLKNDNVKRIFDKEKHAPWKPAGTPIQVISFKCLKDIFSKLNFTRQLVLLSIRTLKESKPDIPIAITVATATPATAHLNTQTKSKFNSTLTIPEKTKK